MVNRSPELDTEANWGVTFGIWLKLRAQHEAVRGVGEWWAFMLKRLASRPHCISILHPDYYVSSPHPS